MKQIRDAILYLLRSVAGYALFFGLWYVYGMGLVTGIEWWIYFPVGILVLELLNVILTIIMKRAFEYDPQFMFKMPVLVYGIYRMVLEFFFLVFLFILFGFHIWIVLGVGLLYLFGVLRHSFRLNRMMIEGTPE